MLECAHRPERNGAAAKLRKVILRPIQTSQAEHARTQNFRQLRPFALRMQEILHLHSPVRGINSLSPRTLASGHVPRRSCVTRAGGSTARRGRRGRRQDRADGADRRCGRRQDATLGHCERKGQSSCSDRMYVLGSACLNTREDIPDDHPSEGTPRQRGKARMRRTHTGWGAVRQVAAAFVSRVPRFPDHRRPGSLRVGKAVAAPLSR
jgi:hypothetical protein